MFIFSELQNLFRKLGKDRRLTNIYFKEQFKQVFQIGFTNLRCLRTISQNYQGTSG